VDLPETYEQVRKRYPDLAEAYDALGHAAHESGPLSVRERRLIKLAMSIGAAHEGATHSHARRALRDGVSEDELRHAVVLATTTLGFPSMVRALTWVEDTIARERDRTDTSV
jgi:alkylhydroperoxidase/carboxymuconolactone decarboxylase family protein YurZ